MECLIGTVSLIGCGDSIPASGYSVNSLVGISLKSVEKLADEEQKDYTGVMDDVEARASKRFPIDVAAKIQARYKLNLIPENIDLGKVVDTTTTLAAAAEYRGLLIDFNKYQSDYKHSDLQGHYFTTIEFYSPSVETGTVFKVIDYATNTTIETFTKNLAVGWNLITSQENYTQSKIAIAVDATSINTVSKELPSNLDWCSSCCGADVDGYKWDISESVLNGELSNNTYGFTINYGARCSFNNLICNNKDRFYLAWQHLLGIEIVNESIFSSRINKYTLFKGDKLELKNHLESEYDRILTQVCDSIQLNSDDCCLECNALFNTVENKAFF